MNQPPTEPLPPDHPTTDGPPTPVAPPHARSPLHDPREAPTGPGGVVGPLGTSRIGKYTLLRQIGAGGMGVVYEAVQEGTDQHVAIKIIRPEGVTDSRLRRFETEIKVLGKLRHPNIAQVYDASLNITDPATSFPYIVLEYIEAGVSITTFARRHELSPTDIVRLFLPVCDAIQAAHDQGVVHRDLKPSNILVEPVASSQSHTHHDSSEPKGRVKVIDFGIARVLTRDDQPSVTGSIHDQPTHTAEGEMMGTVRYMSPEQTRGEHDLVDARSDTYALGVVLHELLTGFLPYASDAARTDAAVIAIQEQSPTPVGEINAALAGDLETIVLKALSKERHRRYASAAQLADDLRRYLAGEAIQARRDSTLYRTRRGLGRLLARQPFAAVAVATIVSVLAVGLIVQPWTFAWTDSARSYAKSLRKVAPPIDPVAPMSNVVLIEVNDRTDMARLAASRRLSGISDAHRADPNTPEAAADRRMWRAVYADLIRLLALDGTRPRAIVFDIMFAGPSDADNAFVDAARELRDRTAAEVVIALPTWDRATNANIISPRLFDTVRSGPAVMLGGADQRAHAMAWVREQPDGTRTPSMALTALASATRPGLAFRVDYEADGAWITYLAPGLPINDPAAALGPAQPLGLSGSLGAKFNIGVLQPDATGLDPADSMGVSDLWIPEDREFAKITHEMESVFAMTPTRRRALFDGKIILIANTRSGVDRATLTDGSGRTMTVPGCWTHVSALDRALADGPAWIAGTDRWSFLILLPAFLAAECARRFARRPRLVFLCLSSLTLAFVLGSLITFVRTRGLLYPMAPCAAVWIAGGLCAALLALRSPALTSDRGPTAARGKT